MHNLIEQFPRQLEDALQRFETIDFGNILQQSYSNIVCVGLGGSGIAASLIQSLCMKYATIPYLVTKSYELPRCTSNHSLFLACSHSGNTEETIEATKAAYEVGATVVIISSGGWMIDFAREKKLFFVQLPGGMMPRVCYSYMLVVQMLLLQQLGFLVGVKEDIRRSVLLIYEQAGDLKTQAKQLAEDIFGKVAIMYSDDLYAPIAMRFRQQLNENSKVLCRNAILPEMNHNEILGRRDKYGNYVPLFLRHSYEHPRTAYRIELSKEIIFPKVESIIELSGIGSTMMQEMLTIIYILDRASVYLADLRGVDPTEIETINLLKAKLAQNPC